MNWSEALNYWISWWQNWKKKVSKSDEVESIYELFPKEATQTKGKDTLSRYCKIDLGTEIS